MAGAGFAACSALAALASLLEDAGFVVDTAADGVQALPKAREFAPDILIVDVEMPGLRGPDLVRKVRDDRGDLPVILMTGHGDEVVASAKVKLRASYVAKPVDIDKLVSAIHTALDNER
jgi:DNA-binding response OmpR family regulator